MFVEQNGNPKLTALGVDQSISTTQSGGNMEGKEVRFGAAACGLFAGVDHRHVERAPSNCMHDSFTPLGGMVAAGQHDARRGQPGRRRRRA